MNMKRNQTGLLSIVIPAKNEETGLTQILPAIQKILPNAEIIVVNDCSTDNTAQICKSYNVSLLTLPYSMGNGAAIKSGARIAKGEILIFLDADGQHNPGDIPKLLEKLSDGYDMVVGARYNYSQATLGRSFVNTIYNRLASWMVGRKIADLTSGFRVVNAKKFKEFLYLLPNGFSYPTTITMSFFRAGYPVGYLPIEAGVREGKSHINPLRDGVRFFLIIFKVGTLYSPLKIFLPISLTFFSTGLGYYIYTFFTEHRFSNMSALLFSTAMLVFLIGLVSEQITSLLYSRRDEI